MTRRDSAWRRLLRRFDRRPDGRDVRDEIESHLALHAADLEAQGMSHADAEREARRRFGDPRRVAADVARVHDRHDDAVARKEYARDLWMDIKLACRQLARRKLFAAVAIGVIALGIGVNAAVFAVVDAALLRPLPVADGDRLVFLWDQQVAQRGSVVSPPEFRDWERQADFLDGICAVHGGGVRLRTDAGWDLVGTVEVAGDPRRALGIQPIVGRWFTAEELATHARVVMLDEAAWRERWGGRADVVGTTIPLGRGPHTVIGVLPATARLFPFHGDSERELWVPGLGEPNPDRRTHFLRVIGRLRADVDFTQAQAAAAAMAGRIKASGVTDHGVRLQRARDVIVGDTRPILYILAGGGLFVLLIVCANLASLFLSRHLAQARELAVRVALGAGRGRLLRMVVTESVVVALVGGAAGLLLSQLMIDVIRGAATAAGALAPATTVEPRVVVFSVVVAIAVGVLAGAWTALRATRVDPTAALKDGGGAHGTSGGLAVVWRRKLLVGVQVAVGVVLLSGTALLTRSLLHMLGEEPGFDPSHVLAVGVLLDGDRFKEQAAQREITAAITRRLGALPGVTSAAVAADLPLEGTDTNGPYQLFGREVPEAQAPSAKKRVVGPAYFEALHIPILRGRGFLETDTAGHPEVVVISESIARRHWPDEDPIGKRIRFDWGAGDPEEVVGVVGDVHHDGLDLPVDPTIYRPVAQFPRDDLEFVVRTDGDPRALIGPARREIIALDSSLTVFSPRTLDDIVRQSTASRRTLIWVIGAFAVIALVLAAMGLYGVVSLVVTQKTREIGLRVALGAQPAQIRRLVFGEAAWTIGAGVLVGLAGAVLAARALSGLLYGVSTADPLSLIISTSVLAGAALAATWIPVRRAARLDPLAALRAD